MRAALARGPEVVMDPTRLLHIADRLLVGILVLIAVLGVLVAWSAGLLVQFGIAMAVIAAPALLARALRGK